MCLSRQSVVGVISVREMSIVLFIILTGKTLGQFIQDFLLIFLTSVVLFLILDNVLVFYYFF